MNQVLEKKVEAQSVTPLSVRMIEDTIMRASERQIGIVFQVKRFGMSNTTYTFPNVPAHEVLVTVGSSGLMQVKILGRNFQPLNQEHQALFLAWLVIASARQAAHSAGYRQPESCMFEML